MGSNILLLFLILTFFFELMTMVDGLIMKHLAY